MSALASQRNPRVRFLTIAGALAGCLLAGTFGTAATTLAATPADDVPSVTVSYSDLNLSTDEGNVTLYRRIVNAARHVCPPIDAHDLSSISRSQSCRADAIARAVQGINSPRLALLYAAHTPHG